MTILTIIINLPKVYASDNIQARIGNKFFDTLEEAITAATSKDTITLTDNITLDKSLDINKTVNINLNNYNIEAEEKVFMVEGGSLNLTGTGKIRETKPNYGAITLKGSDNATDKDYSTVSVGSDITLEGWSGIFIPQNNKTAYGILVNMNGTINAVDDISGGPGAGIYVNGSIQHENNAPIINLSNTTKITSTGNGIYAAGYSIYNINGAYIEGKESALGIKSGIFNIINGTIIGSGPDKTPTSGNNNGINASGTAIQIESNNGYKGNIELNIKNGTIKSKYSNVIYEYTVNNTNTKVIDINLTGGTYTSPTEKSVFSLSNSFKSNHPSFISGGAYSSDPSPYLLSGYSTVKENSLYRVVSTTMSTFSNNSETTNNNLFIIITIISIITIGIILYINRFKILSILK